MARNNIVELVLRGKLTRKGKRVDIDKLQEKLLIVKEEHGDYIAALNKMVDFYNKNNK